MRTQDRFYDGLQPEAMGLGSSGWRGGRVLSGDSQSISFSVLQGPKVQKPHFPPSLASWFSFRFC